MYVLDHKRQLSLIDGMTQLRKDNDTWAVYYHDPSNNVMWKSFFPRATPDNHGPKVLRPEPVPSSLTKRLEDCLIERNPEDAEGLAIELSTAFTEWGELLAILEDNYRAYHRKQLPLFLKTLGIEHYHQLFGELGLDVNDCELDKKKLDKLASRSKKIRFKRFWFP